jgi:hypothetical protein
MNAIQSGELYFGRIRAGDSLDKVIAETKPLRIYRKGEWWDLSYEPPQFLAFTGVSIIARRDRLVQAGAFSCTWQRVFFDEMSPEERADLSHSNWVLVNTASGPDNARK